MNCMNRRRNDNQQQRYKMGKNREEQLMSKGQDREGQTQTVNLKAYPKNGSHKELNTIYTMRP